VAGRRHTRSELKDAPSEIGDPMIDNLDPAEYDALLRQDFETFAARCFHDLNPQTHFSPNWHIEVIAAKLMAVRQGKIRRLIINLPPRSLKSLLASVAFPAWYLGHDPSAQLLCVSYAQDLADKLARDCRGIMMSQWYRRIFPTRLAPHRQAVQEFITTRQGYRIACSNGGALTGRGADIIIIDDPLKPEEALSEAQRTATNDWYDHTLYSRQNDKQRGAIVIIMQRLHEDDLIGHVLAQERWEVLSFPAIAEADEQHRFETMWGVRWFRRRRGDALHPEREPLETLERIRGIIGEYNFAGQYQQSPAPLGGGLVKAEWFKRYRENERPERFDRIVQSWDTANKATELSDFSVCTTWGVKGKDLYLLGVFRRRLEYPALKRAVREQQALFAATEVLIEDKASGTQLIQELIVEGCHGVTRYEPTTEKIMRLHAQTAIIENGFVRIPDTAPWLAEYLHEMTVFPKGKHDDQVDSTAQFLDWFKRPSPGWAYFECTRMQMQAQQNAGNPERHRVCLRAAGDVASVQTLSGRHIIIGPDRTVEVSAEDAESLIGAGWTKLGEWIEDEPAEYEHIKEPNAPEGPQITYAVGSMEWHAQVEKELADRKAALQEEEKRRLARLAAFLGKKT
jgi:predicted phage terminase large subunit-like protein